MLLVCPSCRSIYSEQIEFCGIDGARLQNQAEDPLLGQYIGRYCIESRIGEGAMGCVYLARHTALDKRYAIKVLYGDKAANKVILKRFQREAQAVSNIKHPSIVSMIDFGSTESGLTYLVMELIEGQTLAKLIAKDAPIDLERTVSIARQLAEGLGEAHRAGFVHRDLKPTNVMLERLGQDGQQAKILDFGVVSVIGATDSPTHLTKTGHTLGTPAYMAPEQTQQPSVGPAADLYALGTILFEMRMGMRPFEGPVEQIMAQKVSGPAPGLPPCGGLERVVASLLERKPDFRLGTAQDLLDALDRLEQTGIGHGVNLGALYAETLEEPEHAKADPSAQDLVEDYVEPTKIIDTDLTRPTIKPQRPWPVRWILVLLVICFLFGGFWLGWNRRVDTPLGTDPGNSAKPDARLQSPVLKAEPSVKATAVEAGSTGDVVKQVDPVKAGPPGKAKSSGKAEGADQRSGTKRRARTGRTRRAVRPAPATPTRPERKERTERTESTEGGRSKQGGQKVGLTPDAGQRPVIASDAGVAKPAGLGKLKIKAGVWFDVYIDGKKRYRHPKVAQPLPAGPYKIELKNDEFRCKPVQREIVIVAGKTSVVEARCETL